MKNNRGFLLAEETLKIVIAVIAIGFLIYFLTSLYLKNKESKDLEFAKESLDFLIKNSELGEVEIYNPSSSSLVRGGWRIISFPLNGRIPNSCLNFEWENCICICNKASYTFTDNGIVKDCDESGVCRESDLKVEGEINLENLPIKLLIKEGVITKIN